MTEEPEAEATEAEPTEPEAASAEADADDGGTGTDAVAADAEPEQEAAEEADAGDLKTAVLSETADEEQSDDAEATPAEGVDVVASVTVTSTVTPTSNARRFGALLLDTLLFVVTAGIGWVIWSLFAWRKGQSPAKVLLGMRVVKLETGRAATWGTMLLRDFVGKAVLGMIPLYTLVSAVMILMDSSARQGIWDKIAGTTVVDDPDGNLVG